MAPKTTTDDPEEFIDRWHSHIGELERLRFSVPDEHLPELSDEIKETKERLKEITEICAETFGDEEDDG